MAACRLGLSTWLTQRLDRDYDEFEELAQRALSRNSHSSAFCSQLGHWRLHAFRVSGAPQRIQAAVAAYGQAVELYPNSNMARAQWAWALELAGDRQAAAEQAAIALSLDKRNPHVEQKLAFRPVYDGEPAGAVSAPRAANNAQRCMQRLLQPEWER